MMKLGFSLVTGAAAVKVFPEETASKILTAVEKTREMAMDKTRATVDNIAKTRDLTIEKAHSVAHAAIETVQKTRDDTVETARAMVDNTTQRVLTTVDTGAKGVRQAYSHVMTMAQNRNLIAVDKKEDPQGSSVLKYLQSIRQLAQHFPNQMLEQGNATITDLGHLVSEHSDEAAKAAYDTFLEMEHDFGQLPSATKQDGITSFNNKVGGKTYTNILELILVHEARCDLLGVGGCPLPESGCCGKARFSSGFCNESPVPVIDTATCTNVPAKEENAEKTEETPTEDAEKTEEGTNEEGSA